MKKDKFIKFAETRLAKIIKELNEISLEKEGFSPKHQRLAAKLTYYKEAVDGEFDPKLAQMELTQLVQKMTIRSLNVLDSSDARIQQLVGKIEALRELLEKYVDK